MKKFLLGTTALISAASFAVSAQAADPEVSIGGFVDFNASIADQDLETVSTGFARSSHFNTDAEIHANVEGKADNGLVYGAVVELEANQDADEVEDGGTNVDKAYIYVESRAGRVEMGDNSGAEHQLKVDASSIARAGGGIDGGITDYINTTGSVVIVKPDLFTQGQEGAAPGATTEEGDATKITYFTPRVGGFQAGVSYTPDQGDIGSIASLSADNNLDQSNVWSGGLTYRGQFDQLGVALAVTGETGDSEVGTTPGTVRREDLNAWSVGGQLDWNGFSLAGSFGDWSDSGLFTTATGADGQDYWTAGAAYVTGPFGVSATYIDSSRSTASGGAGAALEDEFNNLVVGADYQLAPGLTPYVEAAFFEVEDASATTGDNEGTIVLLGTTLNF